jgi:hypothetical protein
MSYFKFVPEMDEPISRKEKCTGDVNLHVEDISVVIQWGQSHGLGELDGKGSAVSALILLSLFLLSASTFFSLLQLHVC